MMGEEEMEHSGCETSSPAAHPSLLVLEPIRKKEPHCCPPTPVILYGRIRRVRKRTSDSGLHCPHNRGPGLVYEPTTEMVPKAGLEPARLAPHAPQTCVSAISPLRHPNSCGVTREAHLVKRR